MKRAQLSAWWWALAVAPWGAVACAWASGRLLRDEWHWGQVLFWVPAPVACLCAAIAALCAWRASGTVGRGWRAVTVGAVCVGVWAGAHTLWWNMGWGVGAVAAPADTGGNSSSAGGVVIVHWNPRAPGDDALEHAHALRAASADMYVISNPGAMLRGGNAAKWVPPGWHMKDCGMVAVVSRWPIDGISMLAHPTGPPSGALWIADVTMRDAQGAPLHVRVVDLPSNPQIPRGRVAATVRRHMADQLDAPPPDLLVGDFNSTEGSVLFGACGSRESFPPPWRSVGWLPTFPRAFPLWRIDWMRAGSGLVFERYETCDLGIGLHRAQRATVRRTAPHG